MKGIFPVKSKFKSINLYINGFSNEEYYDFIALDGWSYRWYINDQRIYTDDEQGIKTCAITYEEAKKKIIKLIEDK